MKKLVNSFFWDFSGRLSSQLASFIVGIILARLLSPSDYGLIGISISFITFFNLFLNLGLSSALVQKKEINEKHLSSSFFLNLIASFSIAFILFLTAHLIANFFDEIKLELIIKFLSLGLIIGGLTIVQEAILRKEMKFKILSKARLFSTIVSGLVGVYLAFSGFGVWSLVVQHLLNLFIRSVFYWVNSQWRPKGVFSLSALKELWSFGFNMFLSSLLFITSNQISTLLIAKLFSPFELGLFSRAKNLNEFVYRYSSESISSVSFPQMSKIQDNRSKMITLGLKSEELIVFLSFGLLGLMYATSESLILTLLGKKWVDAIEIYKLLCLSGFVYPLSVATLSMIKAAGYSKVNLKIEVIKSIVTFLGLIIGFIFGLKGYLISLIFTGIIIININYYFSSKTLHYKIYHHYKILSIYLVITISVTYLVTLLKINFESSLWTLLFNTALFMTIYFFINKIFYAHGIRLAQNQILKLLKR